MPLIADIRKRWAELTHACNRRWLAFCDAVMRFRHRRDHRDSSHGPGRFRIAFINIMTSLQHRLYLLGTPLRNLRHSIRARSQDMRGVPAPLKAVSAQTTLRVDQAHTRWWDPALLSCQHYMATRPRKHLWPGLFALVTILAGISTVLLVTGIRPAVTRYTSLLDFAEVAMSNKDYSTALIAYERMLQIGHEDPATRFALARCLAAMGDFTRATQLLRSIAPDDSVGYVPAHRIRAFLILQLPDPTPDDLAIARKHLEHVLEVYPDDAEAHGMLANLLIRQNLFREARDQFAAAATAQPDMALNAAKLSRQINDPEGVVNYGTQAVLYYQKLLRDTSGSVPADPVIALAQAFCVQDKYGEALTNLQDFMPRSDGPRLTKALLEVCTMWQKELNSRTGPQDLDRFRLVKAALTYEPKKPEWQIALLNLASDQSFVKTSAIRLLEQLAQDQTAGPEVCFFLGMNAWQKSDLPAARRFLERSYALKPGYPATCNNLACALLVKPDPDPARALKFVNEALTQAPTNPNFLETRGEALVALGQWSEAIASLQAALPGLTARHDAYEALATAYEKLGQPDKAREQHRLAAADHPQ